MNIYRASIAALHAATIKKQSRFLRLGEWGEVL